MVVLIPSRRADGTLAFKTCVYGPSESGRKTVLEQLYEKGGLASGKLNEIKDEKGSMLFFDRNFEMVSNVIFQVYTFNASDQSNARIVLKGTDSILFIWDSLIENWENNISSLKTLLRFYGDKLIPAARFDPPEVPIVVLANKRDLEDIVDISKLRQVLDTAKLNHCLIYETIAIAGVNLKRAFVYAARQAVLNHYKKLSGKLKEKKTQKEDVEIQELISKYMKLEEEEKIERQEQILKYTTSEKKEGINIKMSEKCPVCGEMCKGIDGLKDHIKACVKKKNPDLDVIIFQCVGCNTFITSDSDEFINHWMYCNGKSIEYSFFQKKIMMEKQQKVRDKFSRSVSIKCPFCGELCEDLISLAKHLKLCQKKPNSFGVGYDIALTRKMLTPSLPSSEINYKYGANPDHVIKALEADREAIKNEFSDKFKIALNHFCRCKACGENLEGLMDICILCGKEIYQMVEFAQCLIKLAKNLMEEHLNRIWKFFYSIDMELYIDSLIRDFEYFIMPVFKGV